MGKLLVNVASSAAASPTGSTKQTGRTGCGMSVNGGAHSTSTSTTGRASDGVDAGNTPFSAGQLKKLKDAFDFFDIDNDGRISCGELRKVLRFLGSRVSEREATRIISEVDSNGNGTVEFNEFVSMMAAYHHRNQKAADTGANQSAEEAEILEAFQAFDHNGDNYIDSTELKKTMQFLGESVTDEDIRCMIREADIDHDGRIDFDEFKNLLATMRRGQL